MANEFFSQPQGRPTIDFRSDTVTQPTAAMREVMATAPVGDDVYGEDPGINALEQRVAQLLGKEAGLFCSSGTQSNLLGIMSHCQRGEEYLVGAPYHTYKYEAGGASVLGGIVAQTLAVQEDGSVQAADIEAMVKADDPHFPISRLIALENTHVGKVVPQTAMLEARQVADRHGLKMHLDGARLFNAHIASGLSLAELGAPFDSVSVCFSKGLGAPVGSMLCGPYDFIRKARRWRKMLGGGMRQAGILAAAVDYALDNHIERLALDHQRAADLAGRIAQFGKRYSFTVEPPQTNMVYLHFTGAENTAAENAEKMAARLHEAGILVPNQPTMRLVVQLNQTDDDFDTLMQALDN